MAHVLGKAQPAKGLEKHPARLGKASPLRPNGFGKAQRGNHATVGLHCKCFC